jgi:hypothetical protein
MDTLWHYLINQMLSVTTNNYKKSYKISLFHDTRLKDMLDAHPADVDYQQAYDDYHPLHITLFGAYEDWKGKGGVQKGETLTLNQLLTLLPARINKIDAKIQAFHDKGSPRWIQLFPRDHLPFYTGSQANRIAALKALSVAIGSETNLAPAKTDVDNLYDEMLTAKANQNMAMGHVDAASNIVEKARVAAMNCQYANLGLFMHKFPTDPNSISYFFDVETITNPEQTIWKGLLDPLENHPTLIRTFEAGDMMRLKANGKGNISAFLASTPGGIDSTEIIVTAGHELIFDVADFHVTDYSTHRYLTIINKSSEFETRFLVELY